MTLNSFNTVPYVVCNEGLHRLISPDQGYKTEVAPLPPFIDNTVAACSKLIVHDVVLHLLWNL